MKGIMFNDHFGLETSVLAGTKTRTSRLIAKKYDKIRIWQPSINMDYGIYTYDDNEGWQWLKGQYSIGDIVAIKQRYSDICRESNDDCVRCPVYVWRPFGRCAATQQGWSNKMFVRNDLMPHQIRITDVKLERVQDISDEDCLREGVHEAKMQFMDMNYYYIPDNEEYPIVSYNTPKRAYHWLIDKVCGKGTWSKNPLMAVYYFELVK